MRDAASITCGLAALTPSLTSMGLDVERNPFASDEATASELLAETERVLHVGERVSRRRGSDRR